VSAGAVFQETVRRVVRLPLPDEARSDVLCTLEAARPGPLPLLYEAGAEAGLSRQPLLDRTCALFLGFAAGSLADDLIDGDADYFADPARRGPCLQYLLQNLCFAWLLESGVPAEALRRAGVELAVAAGQQHVELRTTTWSAPLYRSVAEGIAARQWAAYLSLLWAGTRLEASAWTVGWNTGIAGHVAEDVRSNDPRFFGLGPSERAEIIGWAREALGALKPFDLRCTQGVTRHVEHILGGSGPSTTEEGRDGPA
jgi:hypothetical protein